MYSLLRSKNPNESNFIRKFTVNIDDDDDDDDDNIDNKIKAKVNIISLQLMKLAKTITNNSRKSITKELYEILKKPERYSQTKKEEIFNNLLNIANTLTIKE